MSKRAIRRCFSVGSAAACLLVGLFAASGQAQDFESAPIEYAKRVPRNRVSELMADVQVGKKTLKHDAEFGYLRSLLAELAVPVSSQTLVFSKTSLQRHYIKASTPRALYFNDDTYIGYCQDGDVLEISTVDDDLGAVFYTLAQEPEKVPSAIRQTDTCLICHAATPTKGVPGHTLRSVYSDAAGYPILSSGTYRTDQSSPFDRRWGGWYVTGTHGEQKHLGNIVHTGYGNPERADNAAGQNVVDLGHLLETKNYPTPHSDIVALMVLAHQTEAHNFITRANFTTRQAMHDQESLNRELGLPPDEPRESTQSRIRSVCEPLLEYLFFSDETPLTHKLEGTSGFAAEFARPGPRDRRGRSLRDLDMQSRMFRYPCSYLIYSSSFRALPKEAKEYVFRRMAEILSGKDESENFRHLSPEDRRAVREILADTLPELKL
ncbi:MAG: hypothetical protein K8U03_22255 [Planctomycetia bacterium]|nr:hypothetical protein [Planctomycetia bacterium]